MKNIGIPSLIINVGGSEIVSNIAAVPFSGVARGATGEGAVYGGAVAPPRKS